LGGFVTLIREYPVVHRFLISKYPPIASFLSGILKENKNAVDQQEIEEIISITPIKGKVVADVGAGSGRIAFLVAPFAQTVFAVEPIASFRSFMKEKTRNKGVDNLYVMDGTLDSIPLPDCLLDVLITSNAIGWNLLEELKEIERVVKPGGYVIHLLHSDNTQDNPFHDILVSSQWNYTCLRVEEGGKLKLRYYKSFS